MTDPEHERREASDVPGFGRVGGVDDPVPRAEYGDDRAETLANARKKAPNQREVLRELPDELRGEIRAFFGRDMEPAKFVDRLRSRAEELERHAAALEADEEINTEGGERQ
jgi:hypothetical protein